MLSHLESELTELNLTYDIIEDNHVIIHKASEDDVGYSIDRCYLVKLKNYITNPPPNFTLADNWNRGIIPKSTYLKICITQCMGKMYKVDAVGYDLDSEKDLNDSYQGLWLPHAGMEKIRNL